MENRKDKIKKISISLITITVIILLLLITLNCLKQNQIQLTQLKNNINRQMMGYVIKTQNNKVIVIDGGTKQDYKNLENKINELGGKVDSWFLTHAHDDHIGAFTEIVKNTNIEIENIYVSLNDKQWYQIYEPERAEFSVELIQILNSDKLNKKVNVPSLNEENEIDGIKFEFLGIRNPEIVENPGNEQSMVIKFDTGKTTLIILGDTGEKSSEKLLNTQKEKLKSDIVQISHHGQAGATKELYEAINPTICLWPTTDYLWNNDNGEGENTGPWKTFETRSWIEKLNVKENIIAKDGDITIKIK